jgi:hypothetical protein
MRLVFSLTGREAIGADGYDKPKIADPARFILFSEEDASGQPGSGAFLD